MAIFPQWIIGRAFRALALFAVVAILVLECNLDARSTRSTSARVLHGTPTVGFGHLVSDPNTIVDSDTTLGDASESSNIHERRELDSGVELLDTARQLAGGPTLAPSSTFCHLPEDGTFQGFMTWDALTVVWLAPGTPPVISAATCPSNPNLFDGPKHIWLVDLGVNTSLGGVLSVLVCETAPVTDPLSIALGFGCPASGNTFGCVSSSTSVANTADCDSGTGTTVRMSTVAFRYVYVLVEGSQSSNWTGTAYGTRWAYTQPSLTATPSWSPTSTATPSSTASTSKKSPSATNSRPPSSSSASTPASASAASTPVSASAAATRVSPSSATTRSGTATSSATAAATQTATSTTSSRPSVTGTTAASASAVLTRTSSSTPMPSQSLSSTPTLSSTASASISPGWGIVCATTGAIPEFSISTWVPVDDFAGPALGGPIIPLTPHGNTADDTSPWPALCPARSWSGYAVAISIDLGANATLGGALHIDTCAGSLFQHRIDVGAGCAGVNCSISATAGVGTCPGASTGAMLNYGPVTSRFWWAVFDGVANPATEYLLITVEYFSFLPLPTVSATGTKSVRPTPTTTRSGTATSSLTSSGTAFSTGSGTTSTTATATSTSSVTSTSTQTASATATRSESSTPTQSMSLSSGQSPSPTAKCAVMLSAPYANNTFSVQPAGSSGTVSGTLNASSALLFSGACASGFFGPGPKAVVQLNLVPPNGTFVTGQALAVDSCSGALPATVSLGYGCPVSLPSFGCAAIANETCPGAQANSPPRRVVLQNVTSPVIFVVIEGFGSAVGSYILKYSYPAATATPSPTTTTTASLTSSQTASTTATATQTTSSTPTISGTSSGTMSRTSTPTPSTTRTSTVTTTSSGTAPVTPTSSRTGSPSSAVTTTPTATATMSSATGTSSASTTSTTTVTATPTTTASITRSVVPTPPRTPTTSPTGTMPLAAHAYVPNCRFMTTAAAYWDASSASVVLTSAAPWLVGSATWLLPLPVSGVNWQLRATLRMIADVMGGADGIAVVIHNDPRGSAAVGALGGALGYGGITPSLAFAVRAFDLSLGGLGRASLSLNVDGVANATVDLNAGGIAVGNGDAWTLTISHMPLNGSVPESGSATFGVALAASGPGAGALGRWNFSLPLPLSAMLGGATSAWITVTASTGQYFSAQSFTNFTFAADAGGSGSGGTSVACPAAPLTPTSTVSPSPTATSTTTMSQSSTMSATAVPSRTTTGTNSATESAMATSSTTWTSTSTQSPTSAMSSTSTGSWSGTITSSTSSLPSLSVTASATATVSETSTATSLSTSTPSSTTTVTSTSSLSRAPSLSSLSTGTGTSTTTPTATSTSSITRTCTSTLTPTMSSTMTATLPFSVSSAATNSALPTQTGSSSHSTTATATATISATSTASFTTSLTSTGSAARLFTTTSSQTGSATYSTTTTYTSTSTTVFVPTFTGSTTSSPSSQASSTQTTTSSATPSVSWTSTQTPSRSSSSSLTPSHTPPASRTRSPSATASVSATASATSATATATQTNSATASLTPTGTRTRTATPSTAPAMIVVADWDIDGVTAAAAAGTLALNLTESANFAAAVESDITCALTARVGPGGIGVVGDVTLRVVATRVFDTMSPAPTVASVTPPASTSGWLEVAAETTTIVRWSRANATVCSGSADAATSGSAVTRGARALQAPVTSTSTPSGAADAQWELQTHISIPCAPATSDPGFVACCAAARAVVSALVSGGTQASDGGNASVVAATAFTAALLGAGLFTPPADPASRAAIGLILIDVPSIIAVGGAETVVGCAAVAAPQTAASTAPVGGAVHAGIGIGVVLLVALCALAAFLVVRRRRLQGPGGGGKRAVIVAHRDRDLLNASITGAGAKHVQSRAGADDVAFEDGLHSILSAGHRNAVSARLSAHGDGDRVSFGPNVSSLPMTRASVLSSSSNRYTATLTAPLDSDNRGDASALGFTGWSEGASGPGSAAGSQRNSLHADLSPASSFTSSHAFTRSTPDALAAMNPLALAAMRQREIASRAEAAVARPASVVRGKVAPPAGPRPLRPHAPLSSSASGALGFTGWADTDGEAVANTAANLHRDGLECVSLGDADGFNPLALMAMRQRSMQAHGNGAMPEVQVLRTKDTFEPSSVGVGFTGW